MWILYVSTLQHQLENNNQPVCEIGIDSMSEQNSDLDALSFPCYHQAWRMSATGIPNSGEAKMNIEIYKMASVQNSNIHREVF